MLLEPQLSPHSTTARLEKLLEFQSGWSTQKSREEKSQTGGVPVLCAGLWPAGLDGPQRERDAANLGT